MNITISIRGAFILAILAALGMGLVVKLFTAGFSVTPATADSAHVTLVPGDGTSAAARRAFRVRGTDGFDLESATT